MSIPLLDVRDLTVEFATRNGIVRAIDSVSLSVKREKSSAWSANPAPGSRSHPMPSCASLTAPEISLKAKLLYSGMDLAHMPEAEVAELRGREISMIFQNPRTALNPIRKVGHQIEDVLRAHAQAAGAT